MREIRIIEGIVYCDDIPCNPIGNYFANTHCKECPVLKLCKEWQVMNLSF